MVNDDGEGAESAQEIRESGEVGQGAVESASHLDDMRLSWSKRPWDLGTSSLAVRLTIRLVAHTNPKARPSR